MHPYLHFTVSTVLPRDGRVRFFHFVRYSFMNDPFFSIVKKIYNDFVRPQKYFVRFLTNKFVKNMFKKSGIQEIKDHFFKFFQKIYSFIKKLLFFQDRSNDFKSFFLCFYCSFLKMMVFVISQKFSKLIKLTPSSFISQHVKGYRCSLVMQLNKLRNTLTLLFAAPEPDCFG